MLLKCYHHLHPLSKNANVDQGVDKYCSLDIFGMTASTNELTKFINRGTTDFQEVSNGCERYQISLLMVGEA